jgi:hypothetical protein
MNDMYAEEVLDLLPYLSKEGSESYIHICVYIQQNRINASEISKAEAMENLRVQFSEVVNDWDVMNHCLYFADQVLY